jgi:hypothetical protein
MSNGTVTISTILSVVAACAGGGLTAMVQWISHRGRSNAQEIEIWTRSSVARLHTMHEEMTLLEQRVRSLNDELDRERNSRIECSVQLRRAMELLAVNGIRME